MSRKELQFLANSESHLLDDSIVQKSLVYFSRLKLKAKELQFQAGDEANSEAISRLLLTRMILILPLSQHQLCDRIPKNVLNYK